MSPEPTSKTCWVIDFREWRDSAKTCEETITVRAQGVGRSSEVGGFWMQCVGRCGQGFVVEFLPPRSCEGNPSRYDISFLPISPSGLAPSSSSETHRIYAPRRKGENLSKLHLIVSLVWNGKVVLRGSCFLMENCDCCRLGGFRGPSVWLLKCSTHDIMTVLPYGTADHFLKSRN